MLLVLSTTLGPTLCSLFLVLQVLESLLKEICAALLESDVNVKLVSSLRQSVKATVKASIEGGADKGREAYRKNVAQKVRSLTSKCHVLNWIVIMTGHLR